MKAVIGNHIYDTATATKVSELLPNIIDGLFKVMGNYRLYITPEGKWFATNEVGNEVIEISTIPEKEALLILHRMALIWPEKSKTYEKYFKEEEKNMKTENLRKFVEWAWDFIRDMPHSEDVLPKDWEKDGDDNLVVKGAFEELITIENDGWFYGKMPPAEEKVLVLFGTAKYRDVTTGMYEDGTVKVEDSKYDWDSKWNGSAPRGWWELSEYGHDTHLNEITMPVIAWMPIPGKEGK